MAAGLGLRDKFRTAYYRLRALDKKAGVLVNEPREIGFLVQRALIEAGIDPATGELQPPQGVTPGTQVTPQGTPLIPAPPPFQGNIQPLPADAGRPPGSNIKLPGQPTGPILWNSPQTKGAIERVFPKKRLPPGAPMTVEDSIG